jgi:hypothetical protein
MVGAPGHLLPTPPREPTINVFNFSGGRCRTPAASIPPGGLHQCLQLRWWPLSNLSPAPPQGARHRHLQLWWWPLSDLPLAPPGGSPLTSSASVVAAIGPAASTPLGARHQHFQLRWWLLLDLPPTPCRGPPSMSSASVVAAVGPAASTPLGAHHRRLQLWWWPLPDLLPAPPGAHHRCLLALMVGAPGSLAPIGPTCGFATSPEVGPGASVDTLKIGYPRKQALSQDKKQGVHPHTAT